MFNIELYTPTKKFIEKSFYYKYLMKNECLDFSDEALQQQFLLESFGVKKFLKHHSLECYDNLLKHNGYYAGKRAMDVNLSSWIEDIKNGQLTKAELYNDTSIPEFVLNSIKRIITTPVKIGSDSWPVYDISLKQEPVDESVDWIDYSDLEDCKIHLYSKSELLIINKEDREEAYEKT